MKKLVPILAGAFVSQAVFAATNIIVIDRGSTQPSFASRIQPAPLPWQANLIPLAILAVGLGHLFYPRVAWWFKWGWRFSDPPEPSALWLFFERLGGLLIIAVAAFLFCIFNGVHIPHPQ